jgi:hypothetical protein
MNTKWLIALGVFGVGVLMVLILLGMGVGFHNSEVRLRNLIVNKQTDNKNQMDKMWKTISQVAQVTDDQKQALIEIYNSYTSGRGSGGGGLMKWVQEAVPNVDQSTFRNLQNIVTAERDGFAMRQKEILDFKREHDNLIDTFPNNIFAALLNRQKINVTIVTSSRTEGAFKSGVDDDVSLRGNQMK